MCIPTSKEILYCLKACWTNMPYVRWGWGEHWEKGQSEWLSYYLLQAAGNELVVDSHLL